MRAAVSDKMGGRVVRALVRAIQENRQFLSDVDGLIGDGDHGINMNKGFTLAGARLHDESFAGALEILAMTLLDDVGGSMGPLYSSIFLGMADAAGTDGVDRAVFGRMLTGALDGVRAISSAQPGDKTLMDALCPACVAYQSALEEGDGFSECLQAMKTAADAGRASTVDMAARLGRASRLGERSRGVPDAGATSCCILLCAMADEITAILGEDG